MLLQYLELVLPGQVGDEDDIVIYASKYFMKVRHNIENTMLQKKNKEFRAWVFDHYLLYPSIFILLYTYIITVPYLRGLFPHILPLFIVFVYALSSWRFQTINLY